jgi:hypothetical protein
MQNNKNASATKSRFKRVRNALYPEFWKSRHWPHHVYLTNVALVNQAERWCYDNISPARLWRNSGQYFAFKNQQHSVLFALLWA